MKVSLMRAGNIIKVGLMAIRRNKMRSGLTTLGIIVGVGCVIVAVSITTGAAQSTLTSINALGTNFIMVFPGAATQSGARIFTGQSTLTDDDAVAIKAECPSVAYVSPTTRGAAQIVAGEQNWSTTLQGAGVDWTFIRSWNVAQGAFFTDTDVKNAQKVAVLGKTVAEKLFPDGGGVGQTIRIKNVPFRVLGILEGKGGSTMGQDQDDVVILPYTTAMKRLQGSSRLGMILVGAISSDRVNEAQREIDALLRQRHRIPLGGDADFMMRSQQEFSQLAEQGIKTFSTLLGAIAAVSLLVGGIGIMNIMLVSVTERTREIGIRLAVGAKSRHVLAQFLLEAVILSIVGGALGVAIGLFAAQLVSHFAELPVQIGLAPIVISFVFSALVGVFFGFYPARKASKLDPIEALRYE